MNPAKLTFKYKTIAIIFTLLIIIAGISAYLQLGRLEDPEYTIKEAKVSTQYPGARPKEVEQEVTDILETKIQEIKQLKRITSTSQAGLSIITPEIKDKYDKHSLPQVWDELRRKVNDAQSQLPSGVKVSVVNDDYGDVFGLFMAVTGPGFTYRELDDFVDFLRKEILQVPNVSKVELMGRQQEVIYVDVSNTKLSQLDISPDDIAAVLKSHNFVTPSGEVKVGTEYISIVPSGGFNSVEDIENLLIRSSSKKIIYLKDIATITKGYQDPPNTEMRYNGIRSIGLGISVNPEANIVAVGEKVLAKFNMLTSETPHGIKLNKIYNQAAEVQKSVQGFTLSLYEALGIVVLVLLIAMGVRSGLLIGGTLLLTVFGTFLLMYILGINLERISLGALIIALGMLVDNAIVIVDSILVKVNEGLDKVKAATDVVAKTQWPLLGATVVGILAFAAVSLSQDSTGEYTRSLFYVILISLLLSWVFAVTITPLCASYFLKKDKKQLQDPYAGKIYQKYKCLLIWLLHHRKFAVQGILGLFFLSLVAFYYVPSSFFPESTMNYFKIDAWFPQGTDIRQVSSDMKPLESYVKKLKDVESVSTFIGAGGTRFTLIYAPEEPNPSYAQLLVQVKDYRKILTDYFPKIKTFAAAHLPQAAVYLSKFRFGTSTGPLIEVRFSGPDSDVLRKLAEQALDIMHHNPHAQDIRTDWRQRTKVIEPQYSEDKARRLGINRITLADTFQMATNGKVEGVYRDKNKLIPISLRYANNIGKNVQELPNISIWSSVAEKSIPISQIIDGFSTGWEDPILKRRNRKLTITVQCDPITGIQASQVVTELMPKIDAIKIPSGYLREWGGEYESSKDAQVGLAKKFPIVILAMILLVIILFNAIKQPVIIWLTVPLALIGVSFGLLITGQPFGFMALLGFLSLIGMLIKNAIVLIDQIDIEIAAGKDPYWAIVESSISRFRPVVLAALTTVLGMIPLLFDAFFVSMAVTIMFGLTFATMLTLLIVPVLYSLFFQISPQNR